MGIDEVPAKDWEGEAEDPTEGAGLKAARISARMEAVEGSAGAEGGGGATGVGGAAGAKGAGGAAGARGTAGAGERGRAGVLTSEGGRLAEDEENEKSERKVPVPGDKRTEGGLDREEVPEAPGV